MANRWLFKEEPENYPYERLVVDGSTAWRGVRNAVAQKNLRAARPGDRVLYYHTGKVKAVVGIAEVITEPYQDPDEERLVAVDIAPIAALGAPVTLAQIKELSEFADSPLVRIGRLSVVPITAAQWKAVERLSRP